MALAWTLVKTAIFTVVLPGAIAVYLPDAITRGGIFDVPRDPARLAGFVPLVAGAILYLWCAWDFARVGLGTPAPIDPPKTLVARGPYRWTRNPMYVAVISVIAGECVMTRSAPLWRYALAVFAGFYAFVLLYEEPTLRGKFGDEYRAYCARVPRWIVKLHVIAIIITATVCAAAGQTRAGGGARPALQPIEPVAAILDVFRDHDVVGLTDGRIHSDQQAFQLKLALIRSARFAAAPIDVALEGGNARYQDVIDRYLRGEDVPFAELRRVWDDTTQPQVVNGTDYINPVYSALREVNRSLPRGQQHRAILGDPPIDWSAVHTHDEYMKWLAQRDETGAEMIRREVLARGRKALAIYGGGHLQRKQQASNYNMDSPLAQTVISLLDRARVKTFVITSIDERDFDRQWPVPSLALVRGTTFGASVIPQGSLARMEVKPDGTLVPLPREKWIDLTQEEQIDAVLYLGPDSTIGERPLSPTLCTDPGYLDNRLQRMAIAELPQRERDRLKNFCAKP
jgi:protein-S-isoprenylcysteine O-methyltransferase Ste14